MIKKKFTTPLFLAASFILIGCSSDTIVARPGWQNDNIIVDSNGIKDNKMKAIYDAVKKLGDTNSSILTKVMYDISVKHIGEFTELQQYGSATEMTEILELIKTQGFKDFVKNHSIYKADEYGAIRKDAEKAGLTDSCKLTGDQPALTSFYKIQQQYNQVVNDIYEKLYDEIKGGSYSTTNAKLFEEQLFIDHMIKELYDVPEESLVAITPVTDVIFTPKTATESWKEYVNYKDLGSGKHSGYLNVCKDNGESTGVYDDYINRKILPELYKGYLTQMYVKEQRYSSLGRSYARKVNMVSITTDNTYRFNVSKMLKAFAKDYIVDTDNTNKYNFEYITKTMIGIIDDTEAGKAAGGLIENFDRLKINVDDKEYSKVKYIMQTDEYGQEIENPTVSTPVYAGTKLGDIVKKISQCCDITFDTDGETIKSYSRKQYLTPEQEKIHEELTGNKTNVHKGVTAKEREIRQTDYTKDGWFLKNGGLTDLSTKVRERLFNIKTSTEVDDYGRKAGTEGAAQDNDYVKYFGKTETSENIKARKAFLTLPSTFGAKDEERIVLNEEGNNNFYIIEVQEAVNTSKVSINSNQGSYSRIKSYTTKTEEAYLSTVENNKLVHEIVKASSSNDTYKKNANEYYLMISNIIFYDQSVYDYFKSQFPDLFK